LFRKAVSFLFLTRLTTLYIKDEKVDEKYMLELSERTGIELQDLGSIFMKAGQMTSVTAAYCG